LSLVSFFGGKLAATPFRTFATQSPYEQSQLGHACLKGANSRHWHRQIGDTYFVTDSEHKAVSTPRRRATALDSSLAFLRFAQDWPADNRTLGNCSPGPVPPQPTTVGGSAFRSPDVSGFRPSPSKFLRTIQNCIKELMRLTGIKHGLEASRQTELRMINSAKQHSQSNRRRVLQTVGTTVALASLISKEA
jgi:hypothetical protein